MRTSFNKNRYNEGDDKGRSQSKSSGSGENRERRRAPNSREGTIQAYKDIVSEYERKKSLVTSASGIAVDDFIANMDMPQNGSKGKKKKAKKKGKWVWITLLSLVGVGAISAGVIFGVKMYKEKKAEEERIAAEQARLEFLMNYDWEGDVDNMFIDDAHTDVDDDVRAQMEDFRERFKEAPIDSDRTENIFNTLDTIEWFLIDRETLSGLFDESLNVTREEFYIPLNEVIQHSKQYTDEGLLGTITAMTDSLTAQKETYESLVKELSDVKDFAGFSEEGYAERIDTITYKVNHDELMAWVEYLCAEREVALAKADVELMDGNWEYSNQDRADAAAKLEEVSAVLDEAKTALSVYRPDMFKVIEEEVEDAE